MGQRAIPAVLMRGGTSKGLMLHARDLPAERDEWAPLLTAAMGSPDPYGRQLDGLGGGVSSLSKVCVVAPSRRSDADVDFTFAQVAIREAHVDYGGNCGNMTSAVGPFAVDEGIVPAGDDLATVRIFNTNTAKLIRATFPVDDGRVRYEGEVAIPGVGGTGAPIRLDFLAPGGATTGRLLPTGNVRDGLVIPGFGKVEVSLVDAANATVFVRAASVGLTGLELPPQIEARPEVLTLLEAIRARASVLMGIVPDVKTAHREPMVPFVCVVGPPSAGPTLDGRLTATDEVDVLARAMSNGQPHGALPLTVSLCTAVAARIEGTVVAKVASSPGGTRPLRIGMPSGVLAVDADVGREGGTWVARSGALLRTARRLFDGRVWVPHRPA